MTHQSELFDRLEAEQLRQQGMDVALNADRVQIWKAKAEQWLSGKPAGWIFTSDDLTYAIGVPDNGQNRNNVVGAKISSWAKKVKIKSTGRIVIGKRKSCHGAILREWRVI